MIPYSAWKYCDENMMYEVEGFEVAASSPAGFDLTPWMLSEEECIKLNEEIKEFKNNFNL